MDTQKPVPGQRLTGACSYDSSVLFTRPALPGDIDDLGHVNNAVYVRWVQDAAVGHWSALAEPAGMTGRYIWICLRHEIDYREQVLEGQTVEVRTWLGPLKGPRFDRYTDIRVAGAEKWSVKGRTTWVLLDAGTRKPKRVGSEILDLFGLDQDMLG